ncbi:pp-loop family protein [Rutstroemia sp. NJR-2017a BVV2]|nr:pp-loop family protein [Rutstroemia sp. NJR-2017a BVV2]
MKDTRSAIKSYEFAKALLKKPCHLLRKEGFRGHQRLGLAVSGGVDSMALAALCVRMNQKWAHINKHLKIDPGLRLRLRFTAFIVDHGLRSGSDEEARQVKNNLAKIGIPIHCELISAGILDSKILKLSWKDHEGDPSKFPNLESLARKYRFQALGRACRDHDIDTLLLGHHADDQVETVLMRLAKGHRGRGLAGIKASSVIPECEGIYGVHESGQAVELVASRLTMQGSSEMPIKVESGGVHIYRPLLGFPKEKLISSCKSLGVDWVTDATNADRTLTSRNAIRHMYEKPNKLPHALSAPRILALARHFQKGERRREDVVVELLAKVKLMNFDTRRGTLRVVFPPISDHQVERQTIAAMVLRRVVLWITPHPTVDLLSLTGTAVKTIFPSPSSEAKTGSSEQGPKPFNAAGVFFYPLPTPGTSPATPSSTSAPPITWWLSREPHPQFGRNLAPYIVPGLSNLPNIKTATFWQAIEARWFLYDNRWWLNIKNGMTGGRLMVRNFRPDDSPRLKEGLDYAELSLLNKALRTVNGDDRWRAVLPIVVWRPSSKEEDRVVGLPTLDIRKPGFPYVSWSCTYRKVDLADLGLEAVKVDSKSLESGFYPSQKVIHMAGGASEAPPIVYHQREALNQGGSGSLSYGE